MAVPLPKVEEFAVMVGFCRQFKYHAVYWITQEYVQQASTGLLVFAVTSLLFYNVFLKKICVISEYFYEEVF